MTNTLSVGTALNALSKYMLEHNQDIGVSTGTVNCVVTECNDGELNDIRGFHVKEQHILQALAVAGENFAEGDGSRHRYVLYGAQRRNRLCLQGDIL